ncbi:hypothetical protein CLV62_12542 [Dysgonomonas alginatilytica]|uniref:Uncharacterized protein n=1 Tax=Dysgonomonas alginatilytica TaxID=1605892 RepID=A0A2V3PJY0_9BACT|nr:hypothetical protein [Dysgonomonas alginatilytica]PXV61209.1 hypothetical protein CLV62_12542 [Dysgonomonas alginatilytica]
MAKQTINCEVTESQMNDIIQSISDYMYNTDLEDLSYQEVVDGVRVYVDFSVGFGEVTIKIAEIQEYHYQLTYERDSFVLKCKLEDEVMNHFNEYLKDSRLQAQEIRRDQVESLLNYAI